MSIVRAGTGADAAGGGSAVTGGDGRRVGRALRLLAGAAILGVVGWRLGTGPFLAALRVATGPALVAALVIGAVTTICSAWRWTLVAAALGLRLPLGHAVGAYYRALFLNAVLPGGVLGDVDRAVRHGRGTGEVGPAVRAVVLERAAGQLVLAGAGGLVLLLEPAALPWGPAGAAAARWVVALAGVALLVVVAGRVRRPRRTAVTARAGWSRDVRRVLLAPGYRGRIALASAVVLAGHLTTFVVAARAAGSTAPVQRLVPLALLALLAMTVPLAVGGWGPREGVTAWAFAATGLTAAQGLTVAVVYGLLALVAALPGAAVLAARRVPAGRRRRRQGAAPAVPALPSPRSAPHWPAPQLAVDQA